MRQLRDENRRLKQGGGGSHAGSADPAGGAPKKALRPVLRRELVGCWAREDFRLSERRACRALGVERSLLQHRSVLPTREPLRAQIREIASVRVSYAYRRVNVRLPRDGWEVNRKRIYRLYREEGLCLKRRRPKRRRAAAPRQVRVAATAVNER